MPPFRDLRLLFPSLACTYPSKPQRLASISKKFSQLHSTSHVALPSICTVHIHLSSICCLHHLLVPQLQITHTITTDIVSVYRGYLCAYDLSLSVRWKHDDLWTQVRRARISEALSGCTHSQPHPVHSMYCTRKCLPDHYVSFSQLPCSSTGIAKTA